MEKLNLLAALMRSYSLTSLKFDGVELTMDPRGFEVAAAPEVKTTIIPPPEAGPMRPLTDAELLLWSAEEVARD